MKKEVKIFAGVTGLAVIAGTLVVMKRMALEGSEYTMLPMPKIYDKGKHHVERTYSKDKLPNEIEHSLNGYFKELEIEDMDDDTITRSYVNYVPVRVLNKNKFGKVVR